MSTCVSVFIPVYNGEKYLREVIQAVLNQELPPDFDLELLITDSGSWDSSVSIIRDFGDAVVFDEIPNGEFGHGRTRQRAAVRARGEFLVFLTQDATPADSRWLVRMIEPFFASEAVGCVFGRQIPRADAPPTIKREIMRMFSRFGSADQIVLHRGEGLLSGALDREETFFSDVNSAVRRELLVGEVPFKDVEYAEDLALAQDMLNRGYMKAYTPTGAVLHSNELSAREYRSRKFDEYTALQEVRGQSLKDSPAQHLKRLGRNVLSDSASLIKDPDVPALGKVAGLGTVLRYSASASLGRWQAQKCFGDPAARRRLSLETDVGG